MPVTDEPCGYFDPKDWDGVYSFLMLWFCLFFYILALYPTGRCLRLIQCSETEVLSFTVRLLLSSLKVIISNASLYGQRTYLSNRALTNVLGDMMAIL